MKRYIILAMLLISVPAATAVTLFNSTASNFMITFGIVCTVIIFLIAYLKNMMKK